MFVLAGILGCRQQKSSLTSASRKQFHIRLSQNLRRIRYWKRAGNRGSWAVFFCSPQRTPFPSEVISKLCTAPLHCCKWSLRGFHFCVTPSRFKALGRNICRCPSCQGKRLSTLFSFYNGMCDPASYLFQDSAQRVFWCAGTKSKIHWNVLIEQYCEGFLMLQIVLTSLWLSTTYQEKTPYCLNVCNSSRPPLHPPPHTPHPHPKFTCWTLNPQGDGIMRRGPPNRDD